MASAQSAQIHNLLRHGKKYFHRKIFMHLETLLKSAVEANASDLHLASGLLPRLRIDGRLIEMKEALILLASDILAMLDAYLSVEAKKHLAENLDVDVALTIKNIGRFRVNIFYEVQGIAAAFRIIPAHIPTLDELHLPPIIKSLTHLSHGLILVTGPTGSGKSTTLAAMIDLINREKHLHII